MSIFYRVSAGRIAIILENAMSAIGATGDCCMSVYIQLKTFEHAQSAGLQVVRAPGKSLVYSGFALLVAGVVCMFYVAVRRV